MERFNTDRRFIMLLPWYDGPEASAYVPLCVNSDLNDHFRQELVSTSMHVIDRIILGLVGLASTGVSWFL